MNRIRQIDAELRELEMRREALEAERGKLIAAEKQDSGAGFTPSEKIDLFLSLFRCREDVYPRLWENAKTGMKGYAPACRNEWFRGVCEKRRVKCSECFHQAFPPLDEEAARDYLTGKQTIITHRLAAARHADQILVFATGRVIEAGTHDELLATGGAYAALYNAQASHFA